MATNGATATASVQVVVAAPGAPSVSVTASANPVAGTATTFTISAAPAAGSNTTIRTVSVTFGDGTSANLGAVNGSTTTQHAYASAGTYTATATAEVSNGATATASTQVVVTGPGAPSISVAATGRPVANSPTTFTITTAPPPGTNATITNVQVDFGDNTTVVNLGAVPGSATTQHVYASARTYTVSATATASNGGAATASTQVVVAAPPSPSISIAVSANPVTGRATTFTITTAPAPGSGTTIQNVRVDFGDNTALNLGAVAGTATTQHVYTAAATYNVSAIASDTGGGTATANTSVVVVPAANVSLAVSANPVAGTAAQFTVTVSPTTGVTIQNVTLRYGDGTQDDLGAISGVQVKPHTYAAGGTFTASAVVTIAGGTVPLTTTINLAVCGILSNPVTITSRVISGFQAWPGGNTRFTSATCEATLRAPTGTISVAGDSWSIIGVIGYSNCTVAVQLPICGPAGSAAAVVNGRPICSNPVAAGPVSRATATLNCR
jgi:hypothetical protein